MEACFRRHHHNRTTSPNITGTPTPTTTPITIFLSFSEKPELLSEEFWLTERDGDSAIVELLVLEVELDSELELELVVGTSVLEVVLSLVVGSVVGSVEPVLVDVVGIVVEASEVVGSTVEVEEGVTLVEVSVSSVSSSVAVGVSLVSLEKKEEVNAEDVVVSDDDSVELVGKKLDSVEDCVSEVKSSLEVKLIDEEFPSSRRKKDGLRVFTPSSSAQANTFANNSHKTQTEPRIILLVLEEKKISD